MTAPQTTPGFYALPESLSDDLEKLARMVADLKKGKIAGEQLRAYRVPLGVYEQREIDTYMLRVRLPAGGALPNQLRRLAAVASEYGAEQLHVTTRQDIQIHDVPLDSIHPALVELQKDGLSTKGGGGNTVRNITSCFDAGVCPNEVFDVSPAAVAVTEFLLPDPSNYQLPRKYKLAFSGCARDCAGTRVNDLGFVAKQRGGQQGFAVYAGGGMGGGSRVGELLEEFVPTGDIHLVAEAVKRVFDQRGDRKNRHRARLRFLVERIGFDAFRQLYRAEMDSLRSDPPSAPTVRPLPKRDGGEGADQADPAEGFKSWRESNVFPQKQEGHFLVHIPLRLGDIHADQLDKVANIAESHGEGMIRATQWQNMVLRLVRESELPALHGKLREAGLAETPPPVLRDLIACAGAATCKLGICLSRGLSSAIARRLEKEDGAGLGKLGELRVHISGCPNACGRHPVGDIGLYGSARRVGGRLVPHYIFQLGGRTGETETRLGEGKTAIPARSVPKFMAEFLAAYGASSQCPDFHAYLDNGGRDEAEAIAKKHQDVPDFEDDKNFYFDWGSDELFSMAGRGPGECGAGVFDLIEVDLATARGALDEERLVDAVVAASRALLVTQGHEAEGDAQAIQLFTAHFVEKGLVPSEHRALLDRALKAVEAGDVEGDLAPAEVSTFVQAVQRLYDSMDSSLRFAPTEKQQAAPAEEPSGGFDREADFRGVACPLNFVKTKLLLEQMEPQQTLRVILNEEGARNVPDSVRQEGHEVVSLDKQGSVYELVVRRK